MIVCKYKFNSTLYDLIPVFNDGYTGYTVTDDETTETDSKGNIIKTRTIECDTLPTLMRFGGVANIDGNIPYDKTLSLLEILDMSTSTLTDMYCMFRLCSNLTKVNCEWDTSNVTDIRQMFHTCNSLVELDLSNFDTSNVTSMQYMFYNCNNKLTQLDVSNFNTSKVTDMQYMFYNCNKLTQLDVSNFDTSNVTNMYAMFANCNSLTELNVNNWDTNNVTTMEYMFNECNKLTQLDVSDFDTNNVTNMYNMFYGCNKLTTLDLSNFDTSNVTNMKNMFTNCQSLIQLDVSKFDTSNVTNMSYMFYGCQLLSSLDVSNFDTSNVTNMEYMLYGCNKLTQLDVSKFDTSNVTNMKNMFTNCQSLTQLDVSNFDTSKVTNMNDVFGNCYSLTTLDVSEWNTSNVTDMWHLFYNCRNLTSLDLSNFDTSKVISMYAMFYSCNKLTSLDVSNWNTSNVTTMEYMFNGCQLLSTLDVSNFNTSNVNNMRSMFNGCNSLTTLDLSNIDMTNVTDTTEMFDIASKLEYIKCNNQQTINTISSLLPTRTADAQGTILCKQNDEILNEVDIDTLSSKYWTITNEFTKITEYVFDKSIYSNTIPTFNTGYLGYFCSDVVDENGLVTRTIESVQGLPTLMIFGNIDGSGATVTPDKYNSLLTVDYLNGTNIINARLMFHQCANVTRISSFELTDKNTDLLGIISGCNKLTSIDVSNWNTSNVNNMSYMFNNCYSLISLDLSNWDTSKVTTMYAMFSDCYKLTSLDVSNWNTSNVNNMYSMFYNTPLKDIGMLYCDTSTVNKISSVLPTDINRTIYYQDADINNLTVVNGIKYKRYREINSMINLNNPLLEGDKIVVKDGKLCHYHKMSMVVLDVARLQEDFTNQNNTIGFSTSNNLVNANSSDGVIECYSNNFKWKNQNVLHIVDEEGFTQGFNRIYIRISKSKLSTQDVNGFKQWLQANPTTVIYELAEPYYEDITPLQTQWTIETLEEGNMDIMTNLPIKVNMSYITSVPSLSTLSTRVIDVKESDNLIANLTNMLGNEINE